MGLAGLAGLPGLSGIVPGVVVPPSGLDPDAAAYIAAVGAADGQALEPALVTAYNDFFVGCKADPSPFAGVSNYNAIKASCIMAGARTLAGALVPLVGPAPTNFNFVAGDYTRIAGLIGDGRTGSKQLIAGSVGSTGMVNNNNHVAMWATENPIPPGTTTALFARLLIPSPLHGIWVRSNNTWDSYSQAAAPSGGPGPLGPGFAGMSRFMATQYQFRNTVTQSTTPVSSSGFSTSPNVLVFGNNNEKFTGRLSFYSLGESIDLAALDARLTTLMAAIAAALA